MPAKKLKKHCFALDLKEDSKSIASYREHHKNVWPEIIESITGTGIEKLEIYLAGNRLFMIMETQDHFSFKNKNLSDAENPKVQEWEKLMWKYQQALPFSNPGEKWVLMEEVFNLKKGK